jgi:CRP-like cAMP-binding protein
MEKTKGLRLLHKNRAFSDGFVSCLIPCNTRIEEALVVQHFDSGERQLARALLLLSRYGQDGKPESAIPKITHETLAETIGSTRPRVNIFTNKLRKLGFIDPNGELHVHSSLLRAVPHN